MKQTDGTARRPPGKQVPEAFGATSGLPRWAGVGMKAAIILLAGWLIYSPVFHGGWLWDDDLELTQNIAILDPGGLRAIWRGQAGSDFLPIKSTLQWMVWHVYGNDPTPFHLINVALHLASALMLWRLFSRLGMRHGWLGGLLFVVHPIFVESVSWVSELKNTLSMAALLPAMLAWVNFDERHRWRDYVLTLAWFGVALLCKSSVVMWPVVILLYAWWRRGRIGWGDLLASLPFFAASLAIGITTIILQRDRAIANEALPLGGVASRVALAGLNVCFYLWKLFVPVGLIPMYPQWHVNPPSIAQFLPWPVLAAVGYWLWTKRGTGWGRSTLLGLGFFVINLIPVSGFFKMSFMRISWVSDHLIYVPSIGIVGLAAAGLGALYDRFGGWKRSGVVAVGWLYLASSIFASHQDAGHYASTENMARYTLQANPDAWGAHLLLAKVLCERNDAAGTFEQATIAASQKPDASDAQDGLARALAMEKDQAGALDHYREAVRLSPDSPFYRNNLARCLADSERYVEALQIYDQLLQDDPRNIVFLCDSGVCLCRVGRWDEAVARFRTALAVDATSPEARNNLAVALKHRSGDTGAFPAETPP